MKVNSSTLHTRIHRAKHQAKECLLRGEKLDESFVMDIIFEKLNSEEIKHYGLCNNTTVFCMCKWLFVLRLCAGWTANIGKRMEASIRSGEAASGVGYVPRYHYQPQGICICFSIICSLVILHFNQ